MPTKLNKPESALIKELVKHFEQNLHQFERLVGELSSAFDTDPLLKKLIHSSKWRIKDPKHLRDKLIDKALKAKQKNIKFSINKDNLFVKITDLIGFRLLHLHTQQFVELDAALKARLQNNYTLHEKPKARTWDDEYRKTFKSMGISTVTSERLYTSVHYVFITRSPEKFTCEIQVRTLAEELWGEVDHIFNYPKPASKLACSEQIKVLARATSTCTRLVDSIFATSPIPKNNQRN